MDWLKAAVLHRDIGNGKCGLLFIRYGINLAPDYKANKRFINTKWQEIGLIVLKNTRTSSSGNQTSVAYLENEITISKGRRGWKI